MSFQVRAPVLVIGLGGVGSRLAKDAKDAMGFDYMAISNDARDLESGPSMHVSTGPVVNPSVLLIRGSVMEASEQLKEKIDNYSTVVLMCNLAGKAGSAMAPVVSQICKESEAGLISFAIMPFKYEKDRIFNSGVSLKRLQENSECTIILDNDALLESNPGLDAKSCYEIANSAVLHVVKSLDSSDIQNSTNVLSTSKQGQGMEAALRDSIKMLYGNTPANSVKSSILYVVGGRNIPVGVLNSISGLSGSVAGSRPRVDMSASESGIVMVSSVQEVAKFEGYDPLGVIPDKLDWSVPDCSIDCKLDLYQME